MKIKLFLVLVIFLTSCHAKNSHHGAENIENTIKDIYSIIQRKDGGMLTKKYIHNKYGVYVFYRSGAHDSLSHLDSIKLKNSNMSILYPSLTYPIQKAPHIFKYKQVTFDCAKDGWMDSGFFIYKADLNSSFILNKLNTSDLYCFTDAINGIRFYLKKIGHKWYLYILDEVTGNCDA